MKVKTLHGLFTFIGLGHKLSINASEHQIVYNRDSNTFLVDGKSIIPMSSIREIILDETIEPIETLPMMMVNGPELNITSGGAAIKRENRLKKKGE